jgi:hypothetical protein
MEIILLIWAIIINYLGLMVGLVNGMFKKKITLFIAILPLGMYLNAAWYLARNAIIYVKTLD